MRQRLFISVLVLALIATPVAAQFASENSDETGTQNPSDFSWRYYEDAMKRFPERIGMICHAAYILDKTGSYTNDTLMFMTSCAEHGSVAAMIYLSALYEHGNRMPIDYEKSAYWLKRGANANDSAGYSALAAYHYATALHSGQGVKKDLKAARYYLQRAADGGVKEATIAIENLSFQ